MHFQSHHWGDRCQGPSSETAGDWYYDAYQQREGRHLVTVTASEARRNLFPLIEQVNADRRAIEITSRRGDAVLVSRADWDALTETAMLLRVPANAHWLLDSLAQARAGAREVHPLDRDPLDRDPLDRDPLDRD